MVEMLSVRRVSPLVVGLAMASLLPGCFITLWADAGVVDQGGNKSSGVSAGIGLGAFINRGPVNVGVAGAAAQRHANDGPTQDMRSAGVSGEADLTVDGQGTPFPKRVVVAGSYEKPIDVTARDQSDTTRARGDAYSVFAGFGLGMYPPEHPHQGGTISIGPQYSRFKSEGGSIWTAGAQVRLFWGWDSFSPFQEPYTPPEKPEDTCPAMSCYTPTTLEDSRSGEGGTCGGPNGGVEMECKSGLHCERAASPNDPNEYGTCLPDR